MAYANYVEIVTHFKSALYNQEDKAYTGEEEWECSVTVIVYLNQPKMALH